jgi:hypothetical protein
VLRASRYSDFDILGTAIVIVSMRLHIKVVTVSAIFLGLGTAQAPGQTTRQIAIIGLSFKAPLEDPADP